MNTITLVLSKSGFTCYLKSLLKYCEYCKLNNLNLNVIWISTSHCNGFFLDYFENIENVNIYNNGDNIDHSTKIIYGRLGAGPSDLNELMLKKLKLKPYLREKIYKYIAINLNQYIAVHIRRTDFNRLARCNNNKTADCEFENFINESLKENPNYNIYLATDNYVTQQHFINLYKDKIKCYQIINNDNIDLRKTTLEHAIIDIYICTKANKFMGTRGSSFSETISIFRKFALV